jgi:hypothetical protein
MNNVLSVPKPLPLSSEVTREEAHAMLRAVFNLFARWGADDRQGRILLGQPSPTTYYRWRQGTVASIPHDTVWRLGTLMGIHKALRYMFTEPERSFAWVKKPNKVFNGQSALDRMLGGAPQDLAAVRDYLDAERSGW